MLHSLPIRRALISVSDKGGLVPFARFLADHDIEILSTGGSAKALADAGIPVTEVADFTGFPEMLDGRVKTLHPKIHGGILGIRDNPEHQRAMAAHEILPIDLVVVNLYPFEATVAKGAAFEDCVENIDIGGPALIRAAAKNHEAVTVVVDPEDYQPVMDAMTAEGGATTLELRRKLASAAFARCGAYDGAISRWFQGQVGDETPRHIVFAGRLRQTLRYGENPHQKAAFYGHGIARPGVASAEQLQGKELSYNNINDTDAAFDLVCEFAEPAVAIIKHANPCGVAQGASVVEAYKAALACDPVSAFGGIVALNRPIDRDSAVEITKIFTEVVIAPDADAEARAIFAAKKNLRLLLTGVVADTTAPGLTVRSVAGGMLVQDRDAADLLSADLKVVSKRTPTERELADMLIAFKVCKHVKSNAIVYVKDGATVGIGAGQMSRVDSARIASWKADEAAEAAGLAQSPTQGSVVASDAFFPFADGLLAAAKAGATAVIQPGGSMRDDEVIKAADEAGLAMVFTGLRHFRH
ncbi:bifunctional phosphoribosylaminoimidazolecarboxamide formyltransferase/IMP cyclohydrolase [Rhodospirillum rubrum F11]|uniref:Bifunctional purine biosynthesis protein PurH n=2 Tax=Rhodospirillum rubrum TaxID=1085 RepID=PUR9_RHORT|nr:bifunctional phosphoribosylaminoimidazolecarboxamide formyltransferase/IMP cyclohydrolase [Rhodospirillum rubrum]Q2RN46.1 RecName: Full=Bifunctional purine biosynthesis protein PurH; Includes: RecName: Full=Phosphoribosylaminoimidazolecarboxamide formyltransferase; AltName: Full=AICAR transformylase; Includes: RecName: Full=IMP cyclohydrolase; AltName: Full=ATIC; AltName: Full=IMP synthase; AltName: Full=Inosinicase [Rhodospirillum rubrum ATCC 11170]ABC24449.1 IMP cyclohydrolase / phosphoribos